MKLTSLPLSLSLSLSLSQPSKPITIHSLPSIHHSNSYPNQPIDHQPLKSKSTKPPNLSHHHHAIINNNNQNPLSQQPPKSKPKPYNSTTVNSIKPPLNQYPATSKSVETKSKHITAIFASLCSINVKTQPLTCILESKNRDRRGSQMRKGDKVERERERIKNKLKTIEVATITSISKNYCSKCLVLFFIF